MLLMLMMVMTMVLLVLLLTMIMMMLLVTKMRLMMMTTTSLNDDDHDDDNEMYMIRHTIVDINDTSNTRSFKNAQRHVKYQVTLCLNGLFVQSHTTGKSLLYQPP